MTTIDDLFPSPYLKASDVAHEPVVTISRITQEKLKNKEGKEEVKPILFFTEYEKGIVLNRTNANIIEQLYGPNLDDWMGQRVQLHAPVVEAFGEAKPAIRVMTKRPAADKKVLIERYQKLYERGVKAKVENITDYVIAPESMTAEEITELGKELKAKVEAAEAF